MTRFCNPGLDIMSIEQSRGKDGFRSGVFGHKVGEMSEIAATFGCEMDSTVMEHC